jgi:GNAT superfamily N-acetyltransferase
MSAELVISKLSGLPADLDQLVQESLSEDFRMLERLREEWGSGANCFALPGEALFQARHRDRLVGICGLNRDPHAGDTSVGRVRRLYVARDARGIGIGRRLVCAVVREARGQFATLHVRTATGEGDLFYRALGFRPLASVPTTTHELRLPLDEPAIETPLRLASERRSPSDPAWRSGFRGAGASGELDAGRSSPDQQGDEAALE